MKKFIVSLLIATTVFACVGCSSAQKEDPTTVAPTTTAAEEKVDPTTEDATNADNGSEEELSTTLSNLFNKEIATNTDIEAVANVLAAAADMDCVTMAVSEGYLNGFSGEVTGFSKGYVFSPMIGSIPFIGYVFETDNTEALVATLNSLADPRWNICTEAQDPVIVVSGNYVFFTMCPGVEEGADDFGGFDF